MDVLEAIRTTRSMRRLDPNRPVGADAIRTILEAASKAPSPSNSQSVRWIAVTDASQRKRLGDIYRECYAQVRKFYDSAPRENAPDQRIVNSATHLGEHMGDAPLIVVPCAPGGPGTAGASVYPAVQNLMLAARALGLGTTLTTMHSMREGEVKAILEVPDDHSTYALIPTGYPLGKWGEAKRLPLEKVAFLDRWGGPLAHS